MKDVSHACRSSSSYSPNPILAEAINSQFIPVKVNTLKTPAIHQKYGVKQIPWDVFVTPSGEKLRDLSSERDASRYTRVVNSVAKIYGGALNIAKPSPTNETTNPSSLNPSSMNPSGGSQGGIHVSTPQGTPSNGFGNVARQEKPNSKPNDLAFKSKPKQAMVQNKFFSNAQPKNPS